MRKVHLDTDLGGDIDDLCALAMVLNWPSIELVGVTTVSEDGGRRAGYVRYALEIAGRRDIPVCAGADISEGYYDHWQPGFPDEGAYWPEPIQPAHGAAIDAIALLEHSVEQGATIAAIGPFTNLALLEQRSPGLLGSAHLVLMGGYVFPPRKGFPQWGADMDYNVQVDVKSAEYVLQHTTPTLVPLSVTIETATEEGPSAHFEGGGTDGATSGETGRGLRQGRRHGGTIWSNMRWSAGRHYQFLARSTRMRDRSGLDRRWFGNPGDVAEIGNQGREALPNR
jgi:inosine-uridine nucleoside N-ribohydrolase